MPLYEYRCEGCGEQFEVMQPVSARAEETSCPHCNAQKATRLMSSFASKIVGDHKPGFKEMKAYDMLHERMSKFAKLPPAFGKRADPLPFDFGPRVPHATDSKGGSGQGGS
ncbi:MAG: zinc ribbon domain-containing protein [Nitrospirae bacterium]|nr:zinc ribbon domain-containing protein [Nitrospirota bacterium]